MRGKERRAKTSVMFGSIEMEESKIHVGKIGTAQDKQSFEFT
jgi:hypothetical protein